MDLDRRGRPIVYPPTHAIFNDEWGEIVYHVELSNQTLTYVVSRPGDPLSPEEALETVKELMRNDLEEGLYLSSDFYPPDTQSTDTRLPYVIPDWYRPEEEEEAYTGHYSGKVPASAEAIAALETSVKEGECSVCLKDFDTSSKIRVMPCSHQAWLPLLP
ncbi:hypothetical protein PR202_ga04051 [Eleusine coracana subsp. coracana]|uniref:RING-type domain-containing protein n=1 Tax=Eleusine coracana subsp. coracana TaxID=191504 RepID=A0AAV5BP18_ELECO|nr:hypothetical protein PR202_ga04051 [Eleusine coracana subsp. coracana]